jgi:hypothetical protein
MRTKILSKILLSLGLMFVLGSTITQVHGDSLISAAPATSLEPEKYPLITVHSTGDVKRGKTGSFVLNMNPPVMMGGTYVNFSISGTAIPGVDYVVPTSPAYIGKSGYGVILVQTLPDPRGSPLVRSHSVIIKLEPGPGYVVGKPMSAQMLIVP